MDPMSPIPHRVVGKKRETQDTVTLTLEPVAERLGPILPGQFTMVYARGIGEIPVSVSGTGEPFEQTIRAVGAVSAALCAADPDDVIGVRGPFGLGWDVPPGRSLVFAGGGIGIAPLRAAIRAAVAAGAPVTVLVGARTPADLLFGPELDRWREAGARVEVTVDRSAPGWRGHVGLITSLVREVEPADAVAFLCGPEVMMRFTAEALMARGFAADDIRVSLERNMRCGVGWCGHCQLGPVLVCRDGPVIGYDRAAQLLAVKEW